jgi:uncharacterized membrane protein YeaQ/YmgE (transglycosylase-associated protein family)
MRKTIIAALVGGLIVFIWQTLSWTVLPIHKSETKYTEKQEVILDALSNNLVEEGTYFLPIAAPDATKEQMENQREAAMGNPWAIVSYHKSFDAAMGMNMVRGLLTNMIAVFLLAWLLMKIPDLNMSTAILGAIFVGIIGYLTGSYLNSVWFETNSLPDLIDAVVQWGLCGVWLGFFLTRK